MASTSAIAERIDSALTSMLSFMDDFPDLAEMRNMLSDSARTSLSLEWDHMMADYLTELDEYCRAGLMTSTQQTRYHELLRILRKSVPTIKRLGLYLPTELHTT